MNVETVMNVQGEYIVAQAVSGKRLDGRKLDDFRKIEIEKDLIPNAEGSCRIRMGNTDIIAGVKMAVGTPFSDKPAEGIFISNAELSPMAAARFEAGRPGEDAIELARVVDRGIRESKAIDVEKLCIAKGEKVWIVNLDCQIMNHDGNLVDACALASAIALANTQLPEYDPETETINIEKKAGKLPLKLKPVAVTAYKIGNKLVLDPTLEEEDVSTVKLTVTTKDDGNVCALQKSGRDSLSFEEVQEAIQLSVRKGKELRKLV